MNVYLYQNNTEKILKNAYIGEYHTLEYDFRSQNILTFFWQWDNSFPYWYTAWSWYYTIKSGYYQWQTLWTLPSEAYVSWVKKITIIWSLQNAICCFVLTNSTSWNWSVTWIRWWVSSWWPNQANILTLKWDWSSQEWVFPSVITYPTWDVEFIVDLYNKQFTMKNSGWTSINWTLSDWFVSAFPTAWAAWNMRIGITNWNYNAWSGNYYTYLKWLKIEY